MTDQIPFPPLHDLSPGEHETRKQHLLSEIRREPERRRFSLPAIPRLRLRFALPVAAAVCAVAVFALVFTGAFGRSGTHRSGGAVWRFHFGAQNGAPAVGLGRLEVGSTTLGVNPFGDQGQVLSLQQFIADMASKGYDAPLPDSPLANSSNVGSIWENTATGEVVVYYPSSGIELWYGRGGLTYTGIPASDIQTINGIRAIVFPAGSPDSYFAAVSLPIPSGHLVDLLSEGPVSDLVSVAQTMPVTGR